MSKLIVSYIIENDFDCFKLSYDSIKDIADEIVLICGNDNTMKYFEEAQLPKTKLIFHKYQKDYGGANGLQRNQYIRYLKENHINKWNLTLDADEVVDKPELIKETIKGIEAFDKDCADVHMRHTVGSLGQEDSTVEKHFVPTRLFKITKDIYYDEAEHVSLKGAKNYCKVDSFCIWHLGYSREIFRLKSKYTNHKEKSNIHNPEFLNWWYHSHLLGEFPTKKVDWTELPEVIKKHFDINEDYLYFKDRGVELKHAECVKQWNEYFKPYKVLDVGCGRGPYLRYWEMSTKVQGVEISKWAVDNKLCESHITHMNLLDTSYVSGLFDLVTAIDILEHLEEKDLQTALKIIYEAGNKNFLFSIPFIGDPNLMADSTHKIFKDKSWWIAELHKAGFKIKPTPEHFYFKEQILVAKK